MVRLAFAFSLAVVIAGTTGVMFWYGRSQSSAIAPPDVAAYCAARAQALPASERELREIGCRIAIESALEALAAHRYADSVEQLRAADALLRLHAADALAANDHVAPVATSPAADEADAPPPARPARSDLSIPKRARRDGERGRPSSSGESRDLMDPFASPRRAGKPLPPASETSLTDPFSSN